MLQINLWAVIVAAVASFLIGWVWFLIVFTEPYRRGLDKTAEELAKGPSAVPSLLLQFGGNLVMAYVLAWLMARLSVNSAGGGMGVGFMVWLGFIAAVLGPYYAFQAYPFSFFLINAGYPLVALLIMGALFGVWK